MQLEKEAPKSASSRLTLGQDARHYLAGRRGGVLLLSVATLAQDLYLLGLPAQGIKGYLWSEDIQSGR